MMKPYNILLVDDSKTTNYYNKKIIESFDAINCIYEANNGLEALNFLKNEKTSYLDIILLDINMPIMDGFEFLMEYTKISKELQPNIKIAILTTSNWSNDRERAHDNNDLVSAYIEKPLKKEAFKELLENSNQAIT